MQIWRVLVALSTVDHSKQEGIPRWLMLSGSHVVCLQRTGVRAAQERAHNLGHGVEYVCTVVADYFAWQKFRGLAIQRDT